MDCAAISSRGLRNCCRAAPEVLGAIFVEGVISKFWTGVPWRDMPMRFGEVAALRNRPPGILIPTAKWALGSDVLLSALQTGGRSTPPVPGSW